MRALGEILGELFDLSRLSSGGYRLQHEPFALDRLVAGVCAEFAPIAAAKGLALTSQLAPVELISDAGAIGRMVRNLLDNAIKYTERGQVGVTLSHVSGEARLEVGDTGRGIAADGHGRLFEEFYQIGCWIRAPGRPSAPRAKSAVFCSRLRHLRRRGTSLCLSHALLSLHVFGVDMSRWGTSIF